MQTITLANSDYRIEYDPNDTTNVKIYHKDADFTSCTKSGPTALLIRDLIWNLIKTRDLATNLILTDPESLINNI